MRRRSTGIAAIILLTLFAIGCGQTFRPIATPIPEPGGDPSNLHHAIVVADNGASPGSTSNIDTPGDTNIGNVVVGLSPVNAGFVSNSRTYVANAGENTVTRYLTLAPSVTPVTIPMPPGCVPSYVTSRDAGTAWVACSGSNQVAVMNTAQDSIIATVGVGTTPVGVISPSTSKVYSLNKGAGTITVFSTVDNVVSGTIVVGGAPVWSVLSQNGGLLFVANDAGYISVVDTLQDALAGPAVVPFNTIAVGANPDFIAFDSNRLRLYVANAGSGTVSVIDALASSPNFMTVISTITVGTQPLSLTALTNGTKVYVANCGSDSVSVIDANSLAVTRTITTGTCPVSLASPTDSARVVVGVQGAPGGTNFADPPSILSISTTSDTVLVTLKPAQQNIACSTASAPNNYCPLQRPVFVVMAP